MCTFTNKNILAAERQGLLLNAEIQTQHDDNVLRKTDPISDSSIQVTPELQYLTNFGKKLFSVTYQGQYAKYKDNTKFNYNNHDIVLFASLDHSLKLNSDFKLSYKNEIEGQGTNNSTSLLIQEFNKTNIKQATAKFYYGTKQSMGQLVIGLDHKEYRYTNNSQNFRDLDRIRLTGTFFYRMSPTTRLLLQATVGDYEYLNTRQFEDQSSKESFYLLGAEWDITAKTSGTIKLGYQGKDFNEIIYNDIKAFSYMLNMTWKPNTYSTLKTGASRMTQESSQRLTSAYIRSSYNIIAEHQITPRTKLKAEFTYDTDDIITVNNREDKRYNINLGVDYNLLTWLEISLNYQSLERRSDFEIYTYKAKIIALSITTKFE